MKNLLSLTKVGNLKIGIVRNGKPIATTRILVTEPTKENQENFKIMKGFNPEGEEQVRVTLPFDDIDLNFEVNYVGFVTINDIEYIAKAHDFGDKVLCYPLNPEDFDKKIIDLGELTPELEEHLAMKRTGFLKVMLEGYSGFGEVFYFKTNSINSIRAITDQLRILSALTGGMLAGLPLVIKPIKKDVNEKQIVYLSISFDGELDRNGSILLGGTSLSGYIQDRKESNVNYKAFENLYKETRTPSEEEIVSIEDMKDYNMEVDKSTEEEIKELENKSQEKKSEEEEFVSNFFKEKEINKIPVPVGVTLLKKLGSKEDFEKYFEEERSLTEILQFIK